ncbi:MAG: DUF4105 domain-containing protein [Ectothiorhodospiraceae bacterium]|nr:DUF4105 domain-containing protein [Ectothiorhodospiraceae bacterium]
MSLRHLLVSVLLFSLAGSALARESDAYLDLLLQRAEEQGLAQTRAWQDLLHYDDRRWLPGRRSGTRAPAFFLDPDGWRDPEAELRATLTAFFGPVDAGGDDPEWQHAQCAFAARYHWLSQQLDMDRRRLPAPECVRFQEWYEAINPGVVTLVFADAYLNNPASMFGHTLLRVDPPGQAEGSRLLSYVINHAAATTETSGVVFAVRGLTGGYPGLFSIMPYYEKVQEYSYLENRDLWEYELGLTQEEVDQLMRHVWELRGIPFPYYFLHQNCSYRLLRLLEVARPGLELSDRFNWWATPTDTVRVALEPEGMHAGTVYRPASRTRLEHRLAQLTEEEGEQVRRLAADAQTAPDSALPRERQRLVLESAYDLKHYRLEAGDPVQREGMRELLVARSRLGPPEQRPQPPVPAVRPDQGHGSHRLGGGVGRQGETNHLSLHWRPAYHDLLDPPGGYREGAHIGFGNTHLRYDLGEDRLQLDRLRFVEVESMVPRDPYFRSWSWHVGTGFERKLRPTGGRSLMYGVDGGGGASWWLDQGRDWLFYLGLQGSAWGSERLDDAVRIGGGPRVELLRSGPRWRGRLRAEGGAFSDHSPQWRLLAEQDLSLGERLGLRLSVSRESDFDQYVNRADMVLHWYLMP